MISSVTYAALPYLAAAAPVGGPSAPIYVPGPTGRGTVGLVTNCVVTLTLCIWTAIHLNAFPPGTTLRTRVLRRIGWAMLGMLAPEIVLWRAITQWRVARDLRDRRNKMLNEEMSGDGLKSIKFGGARKPWRLEHGFLAIMGGIGIAIAEDQDQWILREGSTVTPYGVLTLAMAGALPDIEREKVNAKSQADNLAKALVCVQAMWMVIQSIARKAAHLPITLLELHILAHVACAVMMYVIWWKKPQNVNDLLEITVPVDLALFMKLAPDSESWQPESRWRERRLDDPRYQVDNETIENTSGLKVVGRVNEDWNSRKTEVKQVVEEASRRPDGIVMVYPGQSLDGIAWYWNHRDPIHLTAADIDKLRVATRAGAFRERVSDFSQTLNRDWQGKGLTASAPNRWIPGGWEKFTFATLILFSVLGFLYGGVHASSWNAHFPSAVERTMWRIAVCAVTIGGFIISALLFVLSSLAKSPILDGKSWIINGIRWGWGFVTIENLGVFFLPALVAMVVVMILTFILIAAIMAVLGCAVAAYLLSRLFLVVEAVISIRSLPVGAYDTVSWIEYWPHIG